MKACGPAWSSELPVTCFQLRAETATISSTWCASASGATFCAVSHWTCAVPPRAIRLAARLRVFLMLRESEAW